MLSLIIGVDTEGNRVSKNLPALRNLFVSYLEARQINAVITDLIITGKEDIGRLLFITNEVNLIKTSIDNNAETYVYNNPEMGSIKSRNQLFTQVIAEHRKHKAKKENSKKTLVCIDDMWQFYPWFTSKVAINHFRELLLNGYKSNIHFIIGSILPYRNLLVQLMRSDTLNGNRNMVSALGAELIYSPDEIIFFRALDTEMQEMCYPH